MNLPVFEGFGNLSLFLDELEYFFEVNRVEERVAHIFLRRALRGQAEQWFKAIGSVILPEENESKYQALKRGLMKSYNDCLEDDDYEALMISEVEERQETSMLESVMNVRNVDIEKPRPAKRKAGVDEENFAPHTKRFCKEVVTNATVDITNEVAQIENPVEKKIEPCSKLHVEVFVESIQVDIPVKEVEIFENSVMEKTDSSESPAVENRSYGNIEGIVEELVQVKAPQEHSVKFIKDSSVEPEAVESTICGKQQCVSEPIDEEAKSKVGRKFSDKTTPVLNDDGTGCTPSRALKKFHSRKCDKKKVKARMRDHLNSNETPRSVSVQENAVQTRESCLGDLTTEPVNSRPPRKRWKLRPLPPPPSS